MEREREGSGTQVAETYEDPVCGMEVAAADAQYTLESGGVVYYFCSEECLDEFRSEEEDAEDLSID